MKNLSDKDRKILDNADWSADEKAKYGLYHDEYKKFGIADLSSVGALMTVETNWNTFSGKNQFLRIRLGDQVAVVKNEDLREILKIIAPLEEMEKLTASSKRFYDRTDVVVGMKAGKSYSKGETIQFRVDLPIRYL